MKSQGSISAERRSSRTGRRRSKPSGRKKLARILNSVPHVIWSADADGLLTFVSSQWADVYGGRPSELLGDGWIGAIHVEDRDEAVEKWALAKNSAARYQNQFRLRFPSGEFRWVLVTAKPELGRNGKVGVGLEPAQTFTNACSPRSLWLKNRSSIEASSTQAPIASASCARKGSSS